MTPEGIVELEKLLYNMDSSYKDFNKEFFHRIQEKGNHFLIDYINFVCDAPSDFKWKLRIWLRIIYSINMSANYTFLRY